MDATPPTCIGPWALSRWLGLLLDNIAKGMAFLHGSRLVCLVALMPQLTTSTVTPPSPHVRTYWKDLKVFASTGIEMFIVPVPRSRKVSTIQSRNMMYKKSLG